MGKVKRESIEPLGTGLVLWQNQLKFQSDFTRYLSKERKLLSSTYLPSDFIPNLKKCGSAIPYSKFLIVRMEFDLVKSYKKESQASNKDRSSDQKEGKSRDILGSSSPLAYA